MYIKWQNIKQICEFGFPQNKRIIKNIWKPIFAKIQNGKASNSSVKRYGSGLWLQIELWFTFTRDLLVKCRNDFARDRAIFVELFLKPRNFTRKHDGCCPAVFDFSLLSALSRPWVLSCSAEKKTKHIVLRFLRHKITVIYEIFRYAKL